MCVSESESRILTLLFFYFQPEVEEKVTISKEPLCRQKLHRDILDKGIPDDVMPGILNVKVREFLVLQAVPKLDFCLPCNVRLFFRKPFHRTRFLECSTSGVEK